MERFTTSDGVGLAYRTWAGGDGAPGLPPVVLHHGFIANAHLNWVLPGVVDALVAAGRDVVAHDARGHGRSDTPHDPSLYGEDRMAQDVTELADHLGLDRFDLVGYSMGGVTAVLTATREPRVRRLVIGGVGSAIVELGGVDTRVMDRTLLAEVLEQDDPGEVADPGVGAFRGFVDAVGGDRLALAAQARSVHRTPIALGRITAPTLLVVGDADDLASRPEVLVDAIADARLEVVPGDHMGALMAPRFVPAVIEFLAG
ncbi:alpha/beta hydrolase [Iamia sp. SCSIO 61187]|uniref:alpha/beta fold hydrolase n=1 Tax=Iamia sp. SCSIO 61187 TaxID=2722752 RepID=UPI001C637D5B|nr:alpha/beta hydrolase [Iamia sp. SCSIO 61187]QYG94702.1 alpha/beta hydrolase [Iamia sp. SCSIO 61187]